jgi:hypothetical protein
MITDEASFERQALAVFHYQAEHVPVYKSYLQMLSIRPESVKHWEDIPYLPISFFKSARVLSDEKDAELEFTSSGTTGQQASRHLLADADMYEQSFRKGFSLFYGSSSEIAILALLPSYLERGGSSLVYMCDKLIRDGSHPLSGFYLDQYDKLHRHLIQLREQGQPALLIGVSYALLDFFEKYPMDFPGLLLMETGGMKGRRKEMTRRELHERLCKGSGVGLVHSEYGMTELLSQAYARREGMFESPPWMRVRVREINDPFSYCRPGQSGGLNIIDLANAWSCAFIESEDLGVVHDDGRFEVLGRYDYAEARGCSLMIL